MKKNINAFTLLELLIVIGIIGILVALATVSYSSTQKSGRDSKRKQDMVAIQNALEQYYSTNSYKYPVTCSAASGNIKGTWPEDPGAPTRIYTQDCFDDQTGYCVCAEMEKTTSGNSSTSTCNFAANGTHYCVGNLQ